jgi:hypothetical protein
MFPASLFNSFPGNQKKTGNGMVKKNGRLLSKKNLITMADNPTPTETPVVTPPVAPVATTATQTANNPDLANQFMAITRRETGQPNLRVTSLLRTGEQQASAMYNNYQSNPRAQRELYGPAGQQVLDLFDRMRGRPRAEIISEAGRLVDNLARQGQYVSNHLYAAAAAKDVVTLDISLRGVSNSRELMDYFRQNGASKVLYERANNCIHVEMSTGDMQNFVNSRQQQQQNNNNQQNNQSTGVRR